MRLSLISLFSLMLVLCTQSSLAQELPAPSPLGQVDQKVGLTHMSIVYSRPGAKGRKVFGDLVPYGELWRTGANKATKISFSTAVTINGKQIEAGTYAIFTIPKENEDWTVILNKNTDQAGTGNYSEDLDVLRMNVKAEKAPFRETMTFLFDDVKENSANIILHWEETAVSFPVKVDYEQQALKNIEEELKKMSDAYGTYNRIARYYVDNNMKPQEALELAKKSVDMKAQFWNVYTLSLAQAANKNYKEAITTAERSKQLAEEASYEAYVKMNNENIEKWKKMK